MSLKGSMPARGGSQPKADAPLVHASGGKKIHPSTKKNKNAIKKFNPQNFGGRVYISSDHGGFKLKEQLVDYFKKAKISCQDLGPFKYDSVDDYPDYAFRLAAKVVSDKNKGILLCRNGIGVCIAANKVKGIRAISTINPKIAQTSRTDDDTNVLCLGQDFIGFAQAKKVVSLWP